MTTTDGGKDSVPGTTIDPAQFPALKDLHRPGSRKKVPYIGQLEAADCGAACLCMALRYHGKSVRLDEVRAAAGTTANGTDALGLLRAAAKFGLAGRGLRLEVDHLGQLDPGAILHWEFNHFVVFERVSSKGVHIVDPAMGRRTVPFERVKTSFTGVAIELRPGDRFEKGGDAKSLVGTYFRKVMGETSGLPRIIVASVLLQVFGLAGPALTGLIIDRVIPRGDLDLLAIVLIGMAGIQVFQLITSMMRAHLLLDLRTRVGLRMTLGFLDHLTSLPYAFFQRRSTGDLMMRVNSNEDIREIFTSTTMSAILDGFMVVIYLVLLFVASAKMALLAMGLALLEIVVYWLARRRVRELVAQSLETSARSSSFLLQMLAGIETLKLAGAEGRSVQRWSNLLVDNTNVSLARGRLQVKTDAIVGTVGMISPLAIMSLGATLVVNGDLTLGTMMAVNGLASSFITPVGSLVGALIHIAEIKGYIERIDDVLSQKREDKGDELSPGRLSGRIELRDVDFRYDEELPLVVQKTSIVIEPGQTVALVGTSGSGKSTLAKLLLGLYRPTSGAILYDGKNLAQLDLRVVRRQLGIVPQSPYFFDQSIRENIALVNPETPLERVVTAARMACMHDHIAGMRMSYEARLADRGESMSGGQRQRIALARALVHNPAILLLDEATSSLDAETEKKVMENLRSVRATKIIIAHRLSTIADADVILCLDKGQIMERGSHAELIARQGFYYRLVSAQLTYGPDGSAQLSEHVDPNAKVVHEPREGRAASSSSSALPVAGAHRSASPLVAAGGASVAAGERRLFRPAPRR
jgi:ATP-binding cassette subfamily B protein